MATTTDRYILELETAAAERGLNRVQSGMGGLGAKLARLGPLAAGAAAALGGFAAVQGIQNRIDDMDALAKQARQAGVETQGALNQFNLLGTVLEDSGISADEYSRAMAQTMDRLSKGGAQAESVLSKIGPALQTANGELKSGPELLQAMVVAFNQGEISAEEFQAIVGTRVGPLITRALGDIGASAENMASAMEGARDSTDLVDMEALSNAEAFNDNMAAMQRQVSALGTELVSALLPHLVTLSENILAKMPEVIQWVKDAFEKLRPVFDVIGTVLTGVVIPAFEVIFTVLGKVAELIGPLVEAALPGLEAGFRLVGDAITWLIEKVTAAVEWLGRVKDRAIEMKNAVTGAFGDMTSSVTGFAEDAYDGVTGWFGDMYDYVVGNSVVPDMVKGVLGEFDSMSGGMVELVSGAVGGVKSVMTDIANAVGSKFEEITGISLSGIRSQVESMSSTIQSSVSSLTSWVSSSLSGVWNSISNTAGRVGDWFGGFDFSNPFENFAGFFANGGRIPAGQFGVVGEAGPELVSGPANVTPMGDQFGTMVTYNINAVDASSFRALLAQDPGFVHRVVQRGAATATGRR